MSTGPLHFRKLRFEYNIKLKNLNSKYRNYRNLTVRLVGRFEIHDINVLLTDFFVTITSYAKSN